MSLAGKSQHENQEWELWSKKRSAFFNLGLCHFLAYETTVSHQKIRRMMTCAISPAAKLWGFCHLHLIIASLETLRLGAVTKKRNKRIILQQKTKLRICSQVSHSKSKPAWEPLFCSHSTSCFADLAHDTVNSCARQKETSVYKMLHVSLDLPIKSMVSFLH